MLTLIFIGVLYTGSFLSFLLAGGSIAWNKKGSTVSELRDKKIKKLFFIGGVAQGLLACVYTMDHFG